VFVKEIRHYVNRAGRDIYEEWLSDMGDKRTQAKITERINRMAGGNFGDCKPQGVAHRLGTRLSSLLCNRRKALVLLVSGGDKKRQSADIELALEYLRDYKERSQRT
jgi:putative addiction module killer protein